MGELAPPEDFVGPDLPRHLSVPERETSSETSTLLHCNLTRNFTEAYKFHLQQNILQNDRWKVHPFLLKRL